ncbi:hypothetical protein JTE90_012898 [Oedothorax gibbosus]|uniref:Uncharacterized protein n=1 Tax=Oedothorax gibbosus TaxID=931172 RepID=A0AAV6U2L4_9ARAC|nr:hypothetical protein JTE90_012898 [Oedothorax gibbosus]
MSYSQFGYTYPASSQLLEGGGGSGGYDSRLLSFPRLASSFGRLYAPPYDNALYATMPYELKEGRGAWMQQSSACYPYDPSGLGYAADR